VQFLNPYYDFQDSVSYLAGKHTFKFGIGVYAIEADPNIHDTRADRFPSKKHVAIPGVSTALDDYSRTPSRATQLVVHVPPTDLEELRGFVQDDWRNPKLWSTWPALLLRIALKEANACWHFIRRSDGSAGSTIGWHTLWKPIIRILPRVGFAGISRQGTTVVRGSVDLFIFTPPSSCSHRPELQGWLLRRRADGRCTVVVTPDKLVRRRLAVQSHSAPHSPRNSLTGTPLLACPPHGGVVFPAGAGQLHSRSTVQLDNGEREFLTLHENWNLGLRMPLPTTFLGGYYVGNHGSI